MIAYARLWVGKERFDHQLDLATVKYVIGVQETDNLTACLAIAGVEGRVLSFVRFLYQLDSWISSDILLDHVSRVVSRTVVAHDRLPIGVGLGEQGIERSRQEA